MVKSNYDSEYDYDDEKIEIVSKTVDIEYLIPLNDVGPLVKTLRSLSDSVIDTNIDPELLLRAYNLCKEWEERLDK